MENWSKRGFQARGLVQNQSSRGMGDEDDEVLVVGSKTSYAAGRRLPIKLYQDSR
jgi:hypothetical protein